MLTFNIKVFKICMRNIKVYLVYSFAQGSQYGQTNKFSISVWVDWVQFYRKQIGHLLLPMQFCPGNSEEAVRTRPTGLSPSLFVCARRTLHGTRSPSLCLSFDRATWNFNAAFSHQTDATNTQDLKYIDKDVQTSTSISRSTLNRNNFWKKMLSNDNQSAQNIFLNLLNVMYKTLFCHLKK